MFRIFKFLSKQECIYICLCVFLIMIQVWLDLRLPDYMSEITMLVQNEGNNINNILFEGGKMVLCALGSFFTSFVVGFFASKTAAGFSKRLREMVFNKTLSFSLEEINNFSTASLITRSTNDIIQIQTLLAMGLQVMVKAPILAVFAVLKIAGKNFNFTVATGCAVVFLMFMLSIIIIFAIPKSKMMQQLTDNLNRVTRENLTGLRVVRAYNAEDYQKEKLEKANDDLTETGLFVSRIMAIMNPGMTLIFSGLTLSIYWIGANMINAAALNLRLGLFSEMVVFSAYAMQVIMAFMMLTMIFIMMPRASVSAKRILEVLDTGNKILDGKNVDGIFKNYGEIEFKNVSFKYPDAKEAVLHNISFSANMGETVAFIGSTGSGKTTLINLIPRFYDCSDGEVLVDGINVKDYKINELHKKIGYVSQKAVLFSGTINSNIAFGESEYDEERVERALDISQGKEFVDEIGYEGHVSQGGSNFSGGQKQRISIARAIYKNPEIYIFDDSFSALDYKTDKILRRKLEKETANATKLIVAQRIGTIKDADKIIVLDEGKIVGIGKHKELLKNCNIYKEIALSQLSKEELEHE